VDLYYQSLLSENRKSLFSLLKILPLILILLSFSFWNESRF
jgi:hypothetical protein